jgi:hypothetical protein
MLDDVDRADEGAPDFRSCAASRVMRGYMD